VGQDIAEFGFARACRKHHPGTTCEPAPLVESLLYPSPAILAHAGHRFRIDRAFELEDVDALIGVCEFCDRGQHIVGLIALELDSLPPGLSWKTESSSVTIRPFVGDRRSIPRGTA
jgi:hypothetical protein